MKRSRNDMDDLIQLALYMMPKYMKKVNRYNKRQAGGSHHHGKHYEDENIYDKDLINFIEKNILRIGGKGEEKSKKEGKEVIGGKKDIGKNPFHQEINKMAQEQIKKINGQGSEKENNKKVSQEKHDKLKENNEKQNSKDINKIEHVDSKNSNRLILKNKCCSGCNREIKNLLNEFSHEKLDICVEGDESGALEQVNLVSSDERMARFKNKEEEIIAIPIKNIIGMQLPVPIAIGKYSKKDDSSCYCSFEKSMRDYFNRLIGKRVDIQTSGHGKFKCLYNKIINEVGRGFVIIENNVMITFCKIVIIRELKCNEHKSQ
ncbi:hypothetical protein ACYUJ6_07275 [Clostridium sp. JNZ X4-2]